jgi:hypothetical protein
VRKAPRIVKVAVALIAIAAILVVVSIALIHTGGSRGITTNTITTP